MGFNEIINLSNELINRKLTYQDDYENGLRLNYAWMKDGKAYTYSTAIRRPMPDMHLDMKWSTFRNKLTPGQEEEWTLTITKPDGTPADAHLIATLYDKSLDQLKTHSWSLLPNVYIALPHTSWSVYASRLLNFNGNKILQHLNVQWLKLSHLDNSVLPDFHYARQQMFRSSLRMKSTRNAYALDAVPMMEMAVEESMDMGSAKQNTAMEEADIEDEGSAAGEEAKQQEVHIRENLQETAFFMPNLVCDSTGTVRMKFTLPESLTTWRFLGVAHTRDMMFGQMDDEAVARKEVMLQPNMPRFLRMGDQGTISARIINMTDKTISGTAQLQLLDPETEQVIMEQKQRVSVADSSTIGVDFRLQTTDDRLQPGLVIVRMSIATPSHSDGEQQYMALLPATERVTVTVPFTQNGPGTKTVDLEQLIPVKDPQSKLTVEYTNNPAWLMIQALPTIGHAHDDCAICQATSFYANSIGQYILKQNPTAKHVFEQWHHESGTLTSLSSQLQKDEELKDLVLSETPWVADADNEAKQKQQLADFFVPNLISNRLATAVANLRKLQNSDGSWSWWPGMNGSTYITTAVTEMMVRLNEMTTTQDDTKGMLDKAFKFLGNDIVKLVDEMKRQEKKGFKQTFPSYRALQWLYLCAIDGRELPAKVTEANNYLKALLKKDMKNQTIMEKAVSAIVLDNKSYIKSLKEWTVYREDMGRYYDTQRATYSWRDYKIPTQVAAIEALKRLTPQDTTTITEMQRWLLQQKRTQVWDTPLNSADAIYAFLNGNRQALAPQAKTLLAVDGKPIDTSEATAGIGYVKSTVPAEGAKTFTAEKSSTGTSWGAVYAQFTQPSTEIADQSSGITVKREILTKGADARLVPLSTGLTVGDRITIRITIVADRDYDFVQVEDKRAACMEPLNQLSGYNWREGHYCSPKDHSTSFFFDQLRKGTHIIETEYYIDRQGDYSSGTCTVQCAYAPEFRAATKGMRLHCAQQNAK